MANNTLIESAELTDEVTDTYLVICAWCGEIKERKKGKLACPSCLSNNSCGISHGLCRKCYDRLLREYEERNKEQ